MSMNRKTIVALASASVALGSITRPASAVFTPLDISSGFNTDAFVGVKEFQAVLSVGATDVPEAQAGQGVAIDRSPGNGMWLYQQQNIMIGAIDAPTAATIGTAQNTNGDYLGYGIGTSWWAGAAYNYAFKDATQASTPVDGVLTSSSDSRVYHIASHGGNSTLPGDWLEVANPTFTGSGSAVTVPMEKKLNAMAVTAKHGRADYQIESATAILPLAQQQAYDDINVVLGAYQAADGARNMRIVAIYADNSEDILYSFPTDDQINGPVIQDSVADIVPAGVFTAVSTNTQIYGSASGATGAVVNSNGTLYEFTTSLDLDNSKVLKGIRLEDVNPTLNSNARGLAIFGATGTVAIPEPASLGLIGMVAVGLLNRRRAR